ncbi:MAG: hypothetical protein AAF340_07955 [Pseudomonadota bacterium]
MLTSLTLENGAVPDTLSAQYWQDGFLFPLPGMSPAEATNMRAELEAIEHDWLDAGLPLPRILIQTHWPCMKRSVRLSPR